MKRYSTDLFCSGWAWLVVVIALFPRPGGGAVQSLVSERRSFERGVEYQYVYKSRSAIHGNIGIEIDTKVRLSLVKESSDGDQEIRMQCDPTTVQWTTDNGDDTTDVDTFKDLSKWFSVSLSSSGHVTSVHYPAHEGHTILAFKKTIASLISFEQDDVTRGVVNDVIQLNWTHTQQHNHYKKVVTKSLSHNTKEGLISAHLHEVATPTRTTPSSWCMFSNDMTSTSDLRLIKTHPLESGDNHMIGEDLVTDTLEITEHHTYYPLSELEPEILRLLSCNHGNTSVCHQSLSHLIDQLSHNDLDNLMDQRIEMNTHLLSLVDAIALSSSPYSTLILTKLLLISPSLSSQLLQRVLYHFTTTLQPDQESVAAIKSLITSGSSSQELKHSALLALGGMGRGNHTHSQDIVEYLLKELDQYTATPTSSYSSHTHSTLLHSLGNTGSLSITPSLLPHARGTAPHSSLSTQHAAIRAMRHLTNQQSVAVLEEVAEGSHHDPSLQLAAAMAYQRHPRATRDLSHVIKRSTAELHERTRRQAPSNSTAPQYHYNTTMPAVGWNTHFGDHNISVDMSRTVYNSFGISTDPFSSSYRFSIHDSASFTANMLLSNREEHPRFLRTELCLSGRVSYDTNILTDYSQLQLVHKFNRLQEATPSLTISLTDAYNLMLSTQNDYSSIRDDFQTAITNVETRFDTVSSLIEQFATTVSGLSGVGSTLSERGVNISKIINATRMNALSNYGNAVPLITSALDSLLPARLDSFISSLQPGNQPFTTSSFYLPYLRYAPQKAMNNIYSVYRSAGLSLDDLAASTESVLSLTSPHGNQSSWTNPCETVWALEGEISDLLRDVEIEIEYATHQLSPSLAGLQLFQTAIINLLRSSLTALKEVPVPIATSSTQLRNALEGTSQSYDTFTMAYESARTTIDTIFGQQFHPSFPSKLRPCHAMYGCGNYPSTTGALYRDGIDLLMGSQNMLVAPFSGMVSRFDPSTDPALSSYNHSAANTVTLRPTEYSLDSITFIISNIDIATSVMTTPTFVLAGDAVGSFSDFQLSGQKFIHVEAYKTIGGVTYSIDPSQFLTLELNPSATIEWDCNDMVTYVRDVVVDTRPVSSTTPTSEPVGAPLVNIVVPDHEFPQPTELVLEGAESLVSGDSVTFFESSTFLMVGPIPVTLGFSSTGRYQFNTSMRAELLSKSLTVSSTPHVQASVQGSVRVGGATYATVTLTGNLVETTLPQSIGQYYRQWPLVANSSMDLQLTPSNLNLTSRLVRITSAGPIPTEQVLDSQTLWHYLVPNVDRNEYQYAGTTPDPAPPVLAPSPYSNNSTCFVRQLSGRSYSNPAFELEVFISEPQGVPSVSYRVGTYEQGDDIIKDMNIAGTRLVIPHQLVPAQSVFISVQASNPVTEASIGQCEMIVYDRSPPLARVEPIRSFTSRSDQFQVLLSLFDEFGLEDVQYVAMGTVAGENGNDIVDWQAINATQLINTPPVGGAGEDLYAFPRNGRLLGSVLSLSTLSSLDDCLDDCDDDSLCKSFDYSESQQRCILHSMIEAPPSPPNATFTNNFAGLPLQPSRDFLHYEKLGVGNSTLYTFTGLSLQHRQRFFVNLRLRNKLGYMSYVASNEVVVDLTPPLPGRIRNSMRDELVSEAVCPFIGLVLQRCLGGVTSVPNHRIITDGPMSATVFNGPTPLYDALYTSASNFITANWAGFSDPESSIYRYSWCISSSTTYTCDILPRQDPHSNNLDPLFWSNSGLARFSNLSDGSYFITVDAINSVEYGGSLVTTVQHSTPYIVDTQPPVVAGWDLIGYNQTTNQIAVSFNISDAGSGVDRVELSVGHTPLDNDVTDWVTIATSGDSTEATVNVNISDGETAYVKLRAIDKVSHKVVVVDDTPVQVDRTPPIGGRVSDGTMVTSDADYQSSTTTLCVSWDRFSDPHTGISLYQWSAGTSPGSDDIISKRNLTAVEITDRRACMGGLTLSNGMMYYSTIVAYNGAEMRLSVAVTSDGVTIDTSPPSLGTVLDGLSNISYSSSLTTISSTWSGFEDTQSGIASYTVRIYQQPSGSATPQLILTQNVDGTSFTSNQFSLSNGDRVHSEVQAFNGAGLSVIGVSSGYLVDVTAPQVNALSDGLVPGMDLEYQNETESLSISWDAFDDESGIAMIEVAVFRVSEGVRARVHPTGSPTEVLGSTTLTSHTITGLSLTPGMRYITTVTFTNGAGLHRTPYETNGVTIDVTRPLVTMVTVLSDAYLLDGEEQMGVVASTDRVELRWAGQDSGSGIADYLVAVVPADSDAILNPGGDYDSFGTEQGGVVTGLSLTSGSSTSGPFYRVKVIARDSVGLTSTPVYSDDFWVMSGDRAGVVSDGDSGEDVDYTDEVTSVSAHFSGFFSTQCGGVMEYLWAVGRSEEEKSSLLPFTDIGVVFSADGSGYAQTPLPNLRSYQGQRLYTTVRGITGCGQVLEATSDGFIIDSTPPSLDVLRTGHQAIEVVQSDSAPSPAHRMYQNIDTYSSIWLADDLESGLAGDVTVKIGSYPGGGDIQNGSESSANYIRRELKTNEGVSTYVTLEVENRAGLMSKAYSEPVVLDTTLPPMGEISCSTHLPFSPPSLPSLLSQLTCSWLHTNDPESTIASQTISIATDNLDQSRLFSSVLPGNTTNFTSPVLNFTSGQAYYVTLYYTNGAGLENIVTSRAVYYDWTPPVSSSVGVVVLPNYASGVYEGVSEGVTGVMRDSEAVCVLVTDRLSLQYGAFTDPESGIEWYEIGVGHTPGADDIITFHTITPTQSTTSQHLQTTLDRVTFNHSSRRPFYATVRAFNNAGLHSRVTSPPVYVISQSNALQSFITDGSTLGRDNDYQNVTTMISGHVRFGTSCPMQSVEWAIENVDGNLVLNFTSVEPHPVGGAIINDYFVSSNQVQLFDNEAYRIIVRGVDYTGRLHLLKSNGTSVTTQLLVPGSVDDGPVLGLDLSFQESVSVLSAHWSGFGEENDFEQEIEYYEIAAGSDRHYASTRSDVFPFTSIGLRTSYNITGLNLRAMNRYFITVRAHAVSGAMADATSNGIQVGYGHMIVPGTVTAPRYQSDNTSITAHWDGFQSDLPLIYYEWALGSRNLSSADSLQSLCNDITSNYSSQFEAFGFERVELDTLRTRNGLELVHGTSYYVTLRAVDQAKRCVVYSSPIPTVIDQTPPTSHMTTIGPAESRISLSGTDYRAYVNQGDDISLSWEEFTDPESPIDSYEVAFFELQTCLTSPDKFTTGLEVFGYTSVGLATSFSFNGLDLEAGKSYAASVRARNGAGLNTTILTQPVISDTLELTAGSVKDGTNWESDLVFQSDISTLSASFSHAVFQPLSLSGNLSQTACPNNSYYSLASSHADWSILTTSLLDGLSSSAISYTESGQTSLSTDPPGRAISSTYDTTTQKMNSAAYQTRVTRLAGDVTISLTIRAALGDRDVLDAAITSVVFLDSPGMPSLLADFDLEGEGFTNPDIFKGFGLQVHHSYISESLYNQQKVVMWFKDNQSLSEPRYVTQNVTFDLSVPHIYEIRFTNQQLGLTFVRKADLYVDGTIQATLHGLPEFSASTRMILHVFQRDGFVPECGVDCSVSPPSVTAVFSNVTLPARDGDGVCAYGRPFYSWASPIVEFRAGVGTQPGLTDVKTFETISFPCRPCLTGICSNYACDSPCPSSTDPYITTFSLSSSPSSSASGSGSGAPIDSSLSQSNLTLTNTLSPGNYFITIEAVSASGQHVRASSNGVLIDTSPPKLSLPIEQFDVQFSTTQDTRYQGNDDTISARWLFIDEESGIAEYQWAIGTQPNGQDVQPFLSIDSATQAINNTLELTDNTTYYVTVQATNGAGLVVTATSHGITYQDVELNQTQLMMSIVLEHSRVVMVAGENGTVVNVLASDDTQRARTEWAGITDDVAETFWSIGSEPDSTDILPRTDVSFNNGRSATITNGMLLVDSTPLANLSDIVALADGVTPDAARSVSFEPGRLVYHQLEFCSLAHTCVNSDPLTNIVIRTTDTELPSSFTSVTLTQTAPSNETIVLNKQYNITITTQTALPDGERVFAGFLTEEDVTHNYRVAVPYISNPYTTMDQTSREIARRFSAVGGPSFFISFLGADSLSVSLELNVSFDSSIDLATSQVELAYWDIDDSVWREVDDTCQSDSVVDMATRTIRVEVCSTVLPGQDLSSLNRPASLSRRRRQTNSTNTTATPTNITTESLSYLDRPVHFIVMQVGNLSLNTPPSLSFPALETQEDSDPLTLSLKQYVTDSEGDEVLFSLTSVPALGRVNLTQDGAFTYTPCQNCYGVEQLDIMVQEVMFDPSHIPLSAMSRINITILGSNDNPVLFFYDGLGRNDETPYPWMVTVVNVTVETNKTMPTTVAKVGGYDVDGSTNFLQPTVSSTDSSSHVTWLRAFTVAQSLPIVWPDGSALFNFTRPLAFIGLNITYSAQGGLASDQIMVSVRDSGGLFPLNPLTINVEIVPSWCVNGGVCAGSAGDPNCTNTTAQRDDPAGYSCTCPPDYTGQYCEESLIPVTPSPPPECPDGIPTVRCERDPCADATCPSHRTAVCRPSYCGRCVAEWYIGSERVTCSASNATVCHHPLQSIIDAGLTTCDAIQCPCPQQQFECPEDSILVETRVTACCVTYSCRCPNGSCPHLMECADGITPVPAERGVARPGRCCPQYDYTRPLSKRSTGDDGFPSDCPFYDEIVQRASVGCNPCHCSSSWLYCQSSACSVSSCVYNGLFIATETKLCTNTGRYSCTCLPTDQPLEGVWGRCSAGNTTNCYSL